MGRRKLKWANVSEGIRYFLVGMITMIAPVDLIPQDTRTWLIMGMGAAILGLKSFERARGYQPQPLKEKPSID